MQEIKCPKCGEVFKVDELGYAAIVKQVRDKEFDKQIKEREKVLNAGKAAEIEAAVAGVASDKDRELALRDSEIVRLKEKLTSKDKEAGLEMKAAVSEKENEIVLLKGKLESTKKATELEVKNALLDKNNEIIRLQQALELEKRDREIMEKSLKEQYKKELELKDEVIEQYKDFKLRQSTKMIGESLEQHCEIEFNKLRATGFRNAYFEKDNDARSGSKGDYIYREQSEDGVEFISIMFEMKNEADMTATKHRNEDFFKELDKDRNEKKCEYAVLVSMLEADSELYNTGIVDVSHKYPKMYVVRPQFFIQIITLLRNAALNSLDYRRQLVEMQNKNIDVANFEEKLFKFKEGFVYNYEQASKRFDEAIEEIDKSMQHLQKIKDALLASDRQLRLANNRVEDLSIKKLTRNNPTMKAKFEELKNNKEEA